MLILAPQRSLSYGKERAHCAAAVHQQYVLGAKSYIAYTLIPEAGAWMDFAPSELELCMPGRSFA